MLQTDTGATLSLLPCRRWQRLIEMCVTAIASLAILLTSFTSDAGATNNATANSSLPPHTSLGSFDRQMNNLINYAGRVGFATAGVSRTVCIMPQVWSPGRIVHCFVYDADSNLVGMVRVVVEPNKRGQWQGNVTWTPSNAFECDPSVTSPGQLSKERSLAGVFAGPSVNTAWQSDGTLDLCAYLYNNSTTTALATSCEIVVQTGNHVTLARATFRGIGNEYLPPKTRLPYTFIFAKSQTYHYGSDLSNLYTSEGCSWYKKRSPSSPKGRSS
jgi:hypothetical protein